MNPRVAEVTCVGESTLEITFQNGETRIFDVAPYYKYSIYEILKEETFFKKAHVSNGTVAWDNFVDFDPDTLYLEGRQQ